MAFKGVGVFYWALGGVSSFLFLTFFVFVSGGVFFISGTYWGSFFLFDYVSFFLSIISLVLGASLFSYWGVMSFRCRAMLCFSIIMSLLCYTSLNVLVFWISYELCILPLLYLLVVESSYSERFIAFWYLLGYVVLTSLPLLLCIFYFYGSLGGFTFSLNFCGPASWSVLFVLCICFITKIPLPPFHVWLPIVHAEASSPVSVCLSGFIMKLGVLGVFRFAYFALPHSVFSYFYVSLIFCFSVAFLLLASQELDGKRWLAILSLSHIILVAVGLMVSFFSSGVIPFIYCLGHGFSAGLVFIFLWFINDLVGSRNWNILKYGAGAGFYFRFLLAGCLCSVASLPPTLSFFSELRFLADSAFHSFFLLFIFFLYLFLSGLIPLFVLGGCLSRHFSVCSCFVNSYLGVSAALFLLLFCFLFFLLI